MFVPLQYRNESRLHQLGHYEDYRLFYDYFQGQFKRKIQLGTRYLNGWQIADGRVQMALTPGGVQFLL